MYIQTIIFALYQFFLLVIVLLFVNIHSSELCNIRELNVSTLKNNSLQNCSGIILNNRNRVVLSFFDHSKYGCLQTYVHTPSLKGHHIEMITQVISILAREKDLCIEKKATTSITGFSNCIEILVVGGTKEVFSNFENIVDAIKSIGTIKEDFFNEAKDDLLNKIQRQKEFLYEPFFKLSHILYPNTNKKQLYAMPEMNISKTFTNLDLVDKWMKNNKPSSFTEHLFIRSLENKHEEIQAQIEEGEILQLENFASPEMRPHNTSCTDINDMYEKIESLTLDDFKNELYNLQDEIYVTGTYSGNKLEEDIIKNSIMKKFVLENQINAEEVLENIKLFCEKEGMDVVFEIKQYPDLKNTLYLKSYSTSISTSILSSLMEVYISQALKFEN